MNRLKRVVVALVAVVVTLPSYAAMKITPMREVRNMAQTSKNFVIEQDLYIEGFIVSKPHGNNDVSMQKHFGSLSSNDLSTAYIESLSGDIGFKLKLAHKKFANSFPRYAKVVLSLKGATLTCDEPCGVTISGLTDDSIMRLVQCSAADLPRKEKYIRELSDDDMYTYITLKDCEIVFKDGSFLNVYERYVHETPFNKGLRPNKSIGAWATLLCDKYGASIYSLTNTRCGWRRDGKGVPQGAGKMSGIVSHISYPRYGGDVFGRYVILPVDKADYEMEWGAECAAYKSIAEWNWNDNQKYLMTEGGKVESATTERIVADTGNGTLRAVASGKVTRGKDTNNSRFESSGKNFAGIVRYGALTIQTAAHNWWDWQNDCGKGVEVSFSTVGLSGDNLLFGFTFAAGAVTAKTSYGYPVFWNVEYSLDGKEWCAVEGSAPKKLRSLPWYWNQDVNGANYATVVSGAGYTEHVVMLPKELFGKPNVYVRVVPVAKNRATLGYDYNENGALRPNSMDRTVVNFGSFVVRYN